MAFIEAENGYITEKQLAVQLGQRLRGKPYHERTLIEWRRVGRGPPAKRVGGGIWVYYVPHVEAWLQKADKAGRPAKSAA